MVGASRSTSPIITGKVQTRMKTSERTLCRWISADEPGQRKTHKKSEPSLISMARSLFVIASRGFLFRAMTQAVTIRKGAEVKRGSLQKSITSLMNVLQGESLGVLALTLPDNRDERPPEPGHHDCLFRGAHLLLA